MVSAAVIAIGVGLVGYGIAMLRDWHEFGSRWALGVIGFQELLRRRTDLRETANLGRLAAFGGAMSVLIGLGWTLAGIGLATGWLH
jgi:hypothetical protein